MTGDVFFDSQSASLCLLSLKGTECWQKSEACDTLKILTDAYF